MLNSHTMTTPTTEPSAKRKPRPRARDSKEILLGIAAKLFRDFGYNATSIRDIVKRAKIEPSALYYHYSSKEALLDAVLERSIHNVMMEVREAVEKLPANADSRDRITAGIARHLRSIHIHGDFALASRRVIGEIPAALRRKHDAMRAEYGAYWESLFQDAAASKGIREDVRLGLARMFLMGALNWSSEWFDPKKKSPEDVAEFFCGILFEGLSPKSLSTGKRPRLQ